MARVYIAYTGGTIGMARTEQGYAPRAGYLAELMAAMPELRAPDMPSYTVHEYDELLDSANMTPDNWLEIARDIEANYDQYDGFVVLHGTDTMAYTASALPFMLEGLAKPVIVTGSQIPLCEVRSDGRANLVNALLIAAEGRIPEVCLCFGDRLLRGCRSQKVASDGLSAFDSPNEAPLGWLGIHIEIDWARVRPRQEAPLRVQALVNPPVAVLRLFPGIAADLLRTLTQAPLRGLVLETYGVGNGPANDPDFLAALREATERDVVIIACTQCVRGRVDQNAYSAGRALADVGVLPGADMTTEAALAKMFYLFSRGLPSEEIRRLLPVDLRGELTPDNDNPTTRTSAMSDYASGSNKPEYLELWTALIEYLQNHGSMLEPHKANGENYLTLRIGNSNFRLSAVANNQKKNIRVELEIMSEDHVDIFGALEQDKAPIEAAVGSALNWREMADKKRSIVSIRRDDCDVSDVGHWNAHFAWFKATLETFHKTFSPYLDTLIQK